VFVGSRILSIGDIPKDQLYPLKYPLCNQWAVDFLAVV